MTAQILPFFTRPKRRPMATPVSRPPMATPIRLGRVAKECDVQKRLWPYIENDSSLVISVAMRAAMAEFERSGEIARSVNAGCKAAAEIRYKPDPNEPPPAAA